MKESISAYAKINLTLDVTAKRPDGYHELKTIMQSVDLCDTITAETGKNNISLKTSVSYLANDKSNTIIKAASVFYEKSGIKDGAEFFAEKRIPVSAGLGGGSSDAAAVLILLNKMYGTGYSTEELAKMGALVGADVPFCVYGHTAFCEGIGDIVTPLRTLKGATVLLAKTNVSISTKQIFGNVDVNNIKIHPDNKMAVSAIEKGDVYGLSKLMFNVLQDITAEITDSVGLLTKLMLDCGALGSIMTGSGPTVFGIFENNKQAENAYNEVLKHTKTAFLCHTI